MQKRKRVVFIRIIYVLLDIVFVCLSIYVSFLIRQHKLPFSVTFNNIFLVYTHPFQFVFLYWLLAILFFNHAHGLYHTHREQLESAEIWQVFKCVVYSSVVAIVMIYTLKIERFPRSILILSALFMNITLSFWRILKKKFVLYLVTRGYNNFNVLIIGAGRVGTALAEQIMKNPGMGLKIVGYLDDFKKESKTGHRVLGKISDFSRVARREFVNKLFITIHHDSHVFLGLLEKARALRIAVRVIPQGFDFISGEFSKYNIGFIPVLEYCDEEYIIKQAGKRLFDFVLSFIMFLFLLPVFIIIGVLIKLDSCGPVFYFSKRYGRKGKIFHMVKFRSMEKNAPGNLEPLLGKNEADGPIFKIKDDPRITRIGRFLRKYSLDELPQIFNVLKGEMSLVGPRPLPIDQIEKEDLRQLKRLEVRPGITGLWQIRGRSDISFSRLVRWDIWYINNWSFGKDLYILLQTIPVVLKGKGAY